MTLTPKNWHEFQHYKDRKPAWIKLHHSLLDDFEFSRLPVASRALAPCLWLIASEYEGGAITASLEEIAFRLRMNVDELVSSIQPIIKSGFFIDASNMLAERYQDSIPEKKEEGEGEREREDIRLHQNKNFDANDWPSDYEHQFWQQYPRKVGKKAALRALDAVRKRNEVPFPELMAALLRYAAKTDDREFCHPITWINQGRWTDEPATNGNGTSSKHGSLDAQGRRLVDLVRARECAGRNEGADDFFRRDRECGPDVEIIPPDRGH